MTWQERADRIETRLRAASTAYFTAVDEVVAAKPGVELRAALRVLRSAERERDLAEWLADDGGMLDDAERVLVLELVAGALRGRVRDETARRALGAIDREFLGGMTEDRRPSPPRNARCAA